MKRGKNNDAERHSSAQTTVPRVHQEYQTQTNQEPDAAKNQMNHEVVSLASALAPSNNQLQQPLAHAIAGVATTTTASNNSSIVESALHMVPATTPGAAAKLEEKGSKSSAPGATDSNFYSPSSASNHQSTTTSDRISSTSSVAQPAAFLLTSDYEEKVKDDFMKVEPTISSHQSGANVKTADAIHGTHSSSNAGPGDGKTRRTVAATRPGAIRVSSDGLTEEPEEMVTSNSFRITANQQHTSTASVSSEPSLMSSSSSVGTGSRFNKPSRGVAALRPGAVSVVPGKLEEFLTRGVSQTARDDDDMPACGGHDKPGDVTEDKSKLLDRSTHNISSMTPVAVSNSSSLLQLPDFMMAVEQDVLDSKSRGKVVQNTGTVTPGAVAISGSEDIERAPAILSRVERDLESKSGRKIGRNMGTMTPGAVAVSGSAATATTAEPSETPAVLSAVERDLESKNRKSSRNIGAVTPGAVSVSGLSTSDGPPVCEDVVTPAVLSMVERDLESKNSKGARHMEALRPGAVAVSAAYASQVTDVTVTPSMLSTAERDLESKNRKSSRSVGTITPGAVAVSLSSTSADEIDTPSVLTTAELDLENKNRKSARNVGAATPGAVSVSSEEEPQVEPTPAIMTAVDRDLEAKKGKSGRNMVALTPGAMPFLDTNDDMTDSNLFAVRFREDCALAKSGSKTRLGRRALTAGVESVSGKRAADVDAAVSEKYPRSVALADRRRNASERSLSSQGDDSAITFERMEAKIVRMEREEEARVLLRGATAAATTATTAPATTATLPGPVAQTENVSEMGSYTAQIESLDSVAGMEKYSADVPLSDAKDAAAAVGVPSITFIGGTTTSTADRGVSVAPNVVRGSTTLSAYTPGETEGLVVAIAVSEDDEVLRVYGTEYDPDAKPPLYKNRRVRLYGILACILLVAIIGGTLGAVLGTSSKTVTILLPTAAPLSSQDLLYYRLFADAVGNQLVFEPGTPHQLAAEWIIYTDPMKLPAQSDHIIQRYLLVLFYYQMTNNGMSSWRSCNPPTEGQNDTCVFLNRVDTPVVLQNGTAFDNITFNELTVNPNTGFEYNRWLSGAHECLWAGNRCDANNLLQSIELFAQNLTGTLPTEIGAISFLQSFSVPFNLIEGTIPSVYANLRHLAQLELHFNLLTGSFSDIWYQSTGLLSLNLGGNMISGSFTSELGLLSNLKGIFMFQNDFNGTIPAELGKLSYLAFTRWNDNRFEGTIPTEIGSLTLLQELYLYDTLLTGTIPTEIGLLTQLTDLRMNDNKLNGTIPDELYNLNLLMSGLDFSDMSLTGTLSTKIGNLTSLNALKLRNNHLTGTVPTELALLTRLQLIWIHLNDFSGPIPTEICKNRGLAIDYNLQFFDADCGPPGNPTQSCQCCTACCDRFTKICLKQ